MIPAHALDELRSLVGAQNVLTEQEHKIAYSYDGTPLLSHLPDAIVRPQSVGHVADLLRLANLHHFAVVPRGSGSGLSGGSVPVENSVVLLLSHWNKILEIDEENLTALVETGVITSQLHTEVEARGLLYPPDPGSGAISTIGGNVAENSGGLRGLRYGVTRDYVLGMEVVLPQGEVLWLGGKSVKDVAGYNLKDLFIGSEGTLGIITKVLLKLIPKPRAQKTILAYFDAMDDSARTVSAIIAAKITPSTLEFLDNSTIRCVEEYAHLGLPTDIESLLLIEVDGHPAEVDENGRLIEEFCRVHNARNIVSATDANEAARLRAARKVAFTALARMSPTTILEDATVPRSAIPAMVKKVSEVAKKYNLKFGLFGHAGDGNLHPTCLTDERNPEEIRKAELAFEEIFKEAVRLGGTITGEHGVGIAKRKNLEALSSRTYLETMRSIKKALDPKGVLNPGKIFTL